ncbi:hypothetical protein Taro_030965, partial [Colocasia esculenta]|nr:hypothetical protein [Colocasia esculenta]
MTMTTSPQTMHMPGKVMVPLQLRLTVTEAHPAKMRKTFVQFLNFDGILSASVKLEHSLNDFLTSGSACAISPFKLTEVKTKIEELQKKESVAAQGMFQFGRGWSAEKDKQVGSKLSGK